MFRHLWEHARPLTRQQRFFYALGAVFALSTVIHSGVAIGSLVDGQSWSGPVSWRKPVVFAASFALLMVAMAWVLRHLPERRWGWVPTVVLGGFSFIELFVITLQQWRGEPSHFNNHTPLDDALFGVMGTSVGFIVLSIVVFLVWACVQFRGNGGERLAAIVGLAGVLVAGYVGGSMIEAGDAVLAATGEVPYEVVFGAAGSGKLAHFLGLHGLQFLALIAILAPAPYRLLLVTTGTVGYVALFASVTATAYAELPWLSPPLPFGILAIAGLIVCAGTTIATIWLYQVQPSVMQTRSCAVQTTSVG